MPATCLITGATGFIGSHVVEACKRRGMSLRAIARPTSDTGLLDHLGVEVLRGDLADASLAGRAVQGADLVIHSAAKVGDWGPIEEYRAVNVDGLRNLLEACKGQPLERFIHLSSLGVYPPRHHHGTDESEPLADRHLDSYTQSKVEAERLALRYERDFGVPVVVLRPGFVYGPRDRTVLPKIIKALRTGKFRYLGKKSAAMNTIFVGNLAHATLLAIDSPKAVGQVYNLTDGEFVSKQRFIEAIADGLELPRPQKTVPLWLARRLARLVEWVARRRKMDHAPRLTQAVVKLLGMNLDFSIDKARSDLGYAPRTSFDDAIRSTMAWYRENA